MINQNKKNIDDGVSEEVKTETNTPQIDSKLKMILPGKLFFLIFSAFFFGYIFLILGLTVRDIKSQSVDKENIKLLENSILRQINNSKIPLNHVSSIFFITSDVISTQILPEGDGYVCLGNPYPSDMYKIGYALYSSLSQDKQEDFCKRFQTFCDRKITKNKYFENAYFVAKKNFANLQKHNFAITYALYYCQGSEDLIKVVERQIDKQKFQKEWKPFFDGISENCCEVKKEDLNFIHPDLNDSAILFWIYAVNFPKAVFK